MSIPYNFLKNINQILTIFLLLLSNQFYAQLNVTLDKVDSYYQKGETINFNIISNISGTVEYSLKYDNYADPIETGIVNISAGQTVTVNYQSSEPGIVLCTVSQNGNTATAGAAIAPYEIEAFAAEPADFDDFWNAQKNLLSNIPMDPQLTFHSSGDYSTTYRVNLANIDNRRVYGYVSIPNGNGPFPAVISMPAFGSIANTALPDPLMAERGNAITMTISIHNVEPDQVDPNAYLPDDITDENGMYYRYAILAGIRSIDYIYSRPDFDGENLVMMGVSQGAGLSTIVAGLDDRANFLIMSNPVLGQVLGLQYGKAGGFPNYINQSRNFVGTADHEALVAEAVNYYDAIHFAKRFEGVSWTFISYEDFVTPAATSFAVFNALEGQKFLLHSLDIGHFHPEDYWNNRYDFLRRFIPASNTPPFPFSPTDQGYFINAGEDINITTGQSASLSGTVEYNGAVNPSYDLMWTKKEGSGDVDFSASSDYNTDVTFSEDGVYTLQLLANDYSNDLNGEQKYYTLIDEVTVTVGEGDDNNNSNSDCNTPSNLALGKSTNQSSTHQEAESSRAVDGDTNGEYWSGQSVSLTPWSIQPWWEVDLEEISSIDEIKIWNRTDCCNQFLKEFYVMVSDFPFESDDLDQNLNQATVTSFYFEEVAGFPSAQTLEVEGRYVRIQMSGSGFMGLAEVEIFGCIEEDGALEDQQIQFDLIPNKLTSDPPFDISATASSGLAVTYEVVSGPATISGSLVTLTGDVGMVTIQSSQSGNSQYNPATDVLRTFEVKEVSENNCESYINYALNQPTSQSGTQLGATSFRAVDGNTNGDLWGGESVTNTDWSEEAWWEVDLETIRNIEYINVWNRTDCCSEWLSNFYVLVSDEPFISTDLNTTLNQDNVSSYFFEEEAGSPTVININRTGRYVRIQLQGQGAIALAELEVMGCPVSSEFNSNLSHSIQVDISDIYPNPANDFIKINTRSFIGKPLEIIVFNQYGALVLNQKLDEISGKIFELNTKSWVSGSYFIKLKSGKMNLEVLPVLIIKD